MQVRFNPLSLRGLSIALVAVLLFGGAALAQESESTGPFAALTGLVLILSIGFIVAFWVYFALALQTIADKTNTANSWLAWIPIANLFLMLNVAKKPMWWFILFLIPLVSLVMLVIAWMSIAEARGKPNWWGILMI